VRNFQQEARRMTSHWETPQPARMLSHEVVSGATGLRTVRAPRVALGTASHRDSHFTVGWACGPGLDGEGSTAAVNHC
jgi:hypothetical protein